MKLYAFDIETDTTVNGLDPQVAEIISLALWSPRLETVIDGGSEKQRISKFIDLLDSLAPGILCTWNGAVFDGPFIEARARRLGMETGFTLAEDSAIIPKYEPLPGYSFGCRLLLRNHRHADMAYAYREYALSQPQLGRRGWSLKPVCKSLGCEMVEVDRERIHLLTPEENAAYNLSDARGTYYLADRLGPAIKDWIDAVPSQ